MREKILCKNLPNLSALAGVRLNFENVLLIERPLKLSEATIDNVEIKNKRTIKLKNYIEHI